jgi:hypothetical protein
MRRLVRWSPFFFFCAIATGTAYGVAEWFGIPFSIALPVIAVALLINGWLATFEDDLPGGFHNPKKTHADEPPETK